MRLIQILLLCLWLVSIPVYAQLIPPLPSTGSMNWGNWSFEWEIGDENKEGLVIKNVRWNGTKILHKGSLPVIRVKYRGDSSSLGDGCGPYRDRIHEGNISFLPGQLTPVIGRVFDDQIFEIAIFAEIGGYDIYQAWYFHKSGRLEPVVYSSGWSCDKDGNEDGHGLDHKHHPYWRLDFDVEGNSNEVWRIRTKNNNSVEVFKYPEEWNSWKLADDKSIAWTINKPGSNSHVLIRAPSNELRDEGGSPWFHFSSKDMGVRRYHSSEDEGWIFDWDEHLGYKNPEWLPGEDVNGKDIVFWAVGHLSHQWTQADEDNPEWHSTGLTIDVVSRTAEILQLTQMPLHYTERELKRRSNNIHAKILQLIQMPLR
ncbi:MAG: hypothetical protein LV471_07640 [Nitrosomonas sp.]|nr:hypothetical protein [Nitrosomonas sp.]